MNKRLIPYVAYAQTLVHKGHSYSAILDMLKDQEATLAVAIKTLEKVGLSLEEIDRMLKKSDVWKHHFRTFDDLFFDFIDLDDDLIDE